MDGRLQKLEDVNSSLISTIDKLMEKVEKVDTIQSWMTNVDKNISTILRILAWLEPLILGLEQPML